MVGPQEVNKTKMFKLTKGKTIFYILGSCHTLPLEVLHPAARSIISKTTHLFLEVIAPNGPVVPISHERLTVLRLLRQNSDVNWYPYLDESEREILNKVWECIKNTFPENIRVSQLNLNTIATAVFGYECNKGMDSQIENEFFARKTAGNEAYQLDIREPHESFSDDMECDSVESLKFRLRAADYQKSDDIKDYHSGKLQEAVLDEKFEIKNRNQQWMKKLNKFLDEENNEKNTVLVVVGENHLGSEDGLLFGFLKRGYKVERMDQEGQFDIYGNHDTLKNFYDNISPLIEIYKQLNNRINRLKSLDVNLHETLIHTGNQDCEHIHNSIHKKTNSEASKSRFLKAQPSLLASYTQILHEWDDHLKMGNLLLSLKRRLENMETMLQPDYSKADNQHVTKEMKEKLVQLNELVTTVSNINEIENKKTQIGPLTANIRNLENQVYRLFKTRLDSPFEYSEWDHTLGTLQNSLASPLNWLYNKSTTTSLHKEEQASHPSTQKSTPNMGKVKNHSISSIM